MSLARLTSPESIAIVGLSEDPSKHGHRVFGHLRKLNYQGLLYGVNPSLPEIEGIETYRTVSDLPDPPDLVVCAVPAVVAADLISDCEGVGAAIVFASGFGEAGTAGAALEAKLRSSARDLGVRVLGPNSGGLIRSSLGVAASFLTCLDRPADQIRSGPVAVVTQSGGIGSYINNLAAASASGLAVTISTGNESDIAIGEALEAASSLEETRVVIAVLETVRDGEVLIEAVTTARSRGIAVIACRIGRGARGRRLMTTHTGAMAVPQKVLDGVLTSLGVTIAETPGEAYDIAQMVARSNRPTADRIALVTHSGGVAILLSDLAERHGLDLPEPGPALAARLAPLLDHATPSNPLDMGGIIGGPGRFAEVVRTFADSGEYDVVLAVSTAHPPTDTIERARSLAGLDTPVPILHLWMAGDQSSPGLELLQMSDKPVTEEPRSAIGVLSALSMLTRVSAPVEIHSLTSKFEDWGIPVVEGEVARDPDQAVSVANRLGFPVVVKAHAPGLVHKTERRGVRLDLRNEIEVAAAFTEVTSIEGVDQARVERFRPGLEMIIGAIVHPVFGPLAMVGMGGVLTEIIQDVAFAPAPVDIEGARAMIDSLEARRVLDGVRGAPPADIGALAEIVSLVSRGLTGSAHLEVELNPVVWDGRSWTAVDWVLR